MSRNMIEKQNELLFYHNEKYYNELGWDEYKDWKLWGGVIVMLKIGLLVSEHSRLHNDAL